MPKMKSRSSVKKRVRITGSGRLKRMRQYSGCHHILEKKSPKRKRTFRKTTLVHPSDERQVKRQVPYL